MSQYNYAGKQVQLSTDFISLKNEDRDGKIYVINDGNNIIGPTELTVTVPPALTLVLGASVVTDGTFDDGTLVWTLPSVAAHSQQSLDLTFSVTSDCSGTNVEVEYTAVVLGGETDTSNNTASSVLCGIACCDIKPCVNVTDYLSFGNGIIQISGSGKYGDPLLINSLGGTGTNNYSSILPPQLFNPDAPAVIAETDNFVLLTANTVAFVTLNGLVLDDSEYFLVGSVLTVTPDTTFVDTDDEVLVFQHTFAITDGAGVTNNLRQISAIYTIALGDYYIECTTNTFTTTLPTAVGIPGQSFVIKNSGTGVITLDGDGAETIDGGLTAVLNQYNSLTVVSNGANWIIT